MKSNTTFAKFFFAAFSLFFTFFVNAQTNATTWNLTVDGKITQDGKKLDGAMVTVFKNGSQTQQIPAGSNGKFEIVMDPDADYIVNFSKDGLVTKKLSFSTRNVPDDVSKQHSFALEIGEISLFILPQGPDASTITSILNQPIGKFAYSASIKDFDYDAAYTASIQAKLDLIKQAEAQAKQLEKQYNDAIAQGDKSFSGGDWSGAQTAYNAALKIKPDAKYPQNQLVLVNKKEADQAAANAANAKQKALDAQYQTLIASADKSLAGKDYVNAKTNYTQASSLKPNEQYPKDKLAEIAKDQANAQAAADAAAKQKALDAQYQTLIASADKSLAGKDYDNAKTNYTQASSLKPNEQYPKDKLAEIAKDQANAQAAVDAAAKQKALAAQYQTLIANADKSLAGKNYDNAKSSYTQASSLKPNEQYPKDKLAEIDKDIADANAAKSSVEKQKALDAQYQTLIASADKSLAGKNYNNAKTNYTQASSLKPNEQYPKDKLAEIDKDIADANAAKSSAEKQKALDAQYQTLIANADKSLAGKDYDNAKTNYTQASSLKPNEQYPKDKLAEIDKDIADANAAKSSAEKQKALDAQYQTLIASADKSLAGKNYDNAKTNYTQASSLKPNEQYPKDKLAEIDKDIADANAAKSSAEKQKALDAQYQTLIASADKSLAGKNYDNAKTNYTQASSLKPNEQYPKDKLAEIDKDIADANAAKSSAEKQKALDAQYQTLIASADKSLAGKNYDNAKTNYTQASSLKPNEQYPKDKLAEIDKDIADANAAKSSAEKQKALDAQYQTLIASADKSLAGKDYDNAKTNYTQASSLKPNEQYPKDKLAEIDKTIAAEQATNAEKSAEAAKEKELNDQYAAAIRSADELLGNKEYDNAKKGYNNALMLKPAEQYPKDKIKEINADIAAMAASNSAAAEAAAKQKALDEKYDNLIATADEAKSASKYMDAKTAYQQASALKPNEEYPKDKIAEINNKEIALQEAAKKEAQYKLLIVKADQQFSTKKYKLAQAYYQQASTTKSDEQYPKDQLKKIDDLLHPKATTETPTNVATTVDPTTPTQDSVNPLVKEYGQGVTEQHTQDANTDVTVRIVVKGNYAYVYKKVVWNFGQVDYYKNDVPITSSTYENETSH